MSINDELVLFARMAKALSEGDEAELLAVATELEHLEALDAA